MPITNNNYACDYKRKKKPLLIGCSGGGGHISAIQGVRSFLADKYQRNIRFMPHAPVLHAQKRGSWSRTNITVGSVATNDILILSPILKSILSFTTLPTLPGSSSLKDEVDTLNTKETQSKSREYIDMLLDIYPAGYESAAIWNVLQRTDQTTVLKKLIELQSRTDQENYADVCRDILKLLKDAAARTPYTEIISTQAMGLPALCDTVKKYNATYPDKPQIVIHQYMTDLPTKGAVHFFNALKALKPVQQKQMKLYGVGMTQATLDHFFPHGQHFTGVYNIPAHENPMVRAGFKDRTYDNSKKFNLGVTLSLIDHNPVSVGRHEQVASIMLGSQASRATVEYIETLIENGMNKVFVFGGKNYSISKKIDAILKKHPEYEDRIIRLGNQGDQQIAQVMTRSNIVIIRGGGLSVMEQMAMHHNNRQTVLIHHANSNARELTSGISWEDDNVRALIAHLKEKKVHAEKTSPELAKRQIAEARLIAAAKRSRKWTTNEISRYIQNLPLEKLVYHVNLLQKHNGPKNIRHLNHYLNACKAKDIEKQQKLNHKISLIIESLRAQCENCKHYINTVLTVELAKLPERPSTIEQAVEESHLKAYKQLAPAFFSAIACYKAVQRLLATVTVEANTISSSEKLNNFKNEYEKPETRNALRYSNDNFIIRFIRELNYILSKIFIFNCMGLDRFFTPEQTLRRQMETLNLENTETKTAYPAA